MANTSKDGKILKSLSPKEILWITWATESGKEFLITSDSLRTNYILYLKVPIGYQKIMTSKEYQKIEKYITEN